MKHLFSRKVVVAALCVILGLSSALGVNAAQQNYMTREAVIKNSSAVAYSEPTGSNTFYFEYSATCNIGKIDVNPQILMNLNYENAEGFVLDKVLHAGETTGVMYLYASPYKIARLKLANSGQGTGYIQGLG